MGSVSRTNVVAAVVAALGLLLLAGLVMPATADGATEARCSVRGAGAGYTGMLGVRCVAKRPSPTRTVGATRRQARPRCATPAPYYSQVPVRPGC